jgi:hypothetical protein
MRTQPTLEQLLGRVFDGAREGLRKKVDPAEYEKRRHDFVFHMTDWQSDLDRLADLFKNPDKYDEESASTLLMGFLYHVIPHLDAAGCLLLDKVSSSFCPGGQDDQA